MYEYEVVALGKSIEGIKTQLNTHGEQGWELVGILSQPNIYQLDTASGISRPILKFDTNSGDIAYFKRSKIKKMS